MQGVVVGQCWTIGRTAPVQIGSESADQVGQCNICCQAMKCSAGTMKCSDRTMQWSVRVRQCKVGQCNAEVRQCNAQMSVRSVGECKVGQCQAIQRRAGGWGWDVQLVQNGKVTFPKKMRLGNNNKKGGKECGEYVEANEYVEQNCQRISSTFFVKLVCVSRIVSSLNPSVSLPLSNPSVIV